MEVYGNSGVGNLVAAAHVAVADNEGTGIPTYIGQPFGFTPLLATGLSGNIIMTLATDNHIAPTDCVIMISLDLAGVGTGKLVTAEKVTESNIDVRIANSLGATDIADFWITVFRKG